MPTGHTAIIKNDEGCTFEQYLWTCTRAFLFHARDVRSGERIPLATVSVFYEQRLREVKSELQALSGMRPDQVHDLGLKLLTDKFTNYEKWQQERLRNRGRYLTMRDRVSSWECPVEYQELRGFMLQQIDRCEVNFKSDMTPVPGPPYTMDECLAAFVAHRNHLEEQKCECEKDLSKAVSRAENTNKWIKALESLVPQKPKGEP